MKISYCFTSIVAKYYGKEKSEEKARQQQFSSKTLKETSVMHRPAANITVACFVDMHLTCLNDGWGIKRFSATNTLRDGLAGKKPKRISPPQIMLNEGASKPFGKAPFSSAAISALIEAGLYCARSLPTSE